MTAPGVVEARGLKVERGGVPVLDVPSFRLEAGEFVSLVGPNGSGKSTLLLSLMTLLPRAAGQVLWHGTAIASDAQAIACRRRMALVLQEPLLFQGTVRENVASGLRMRGLPRRELERQVAEALARFGLEPLARRPALELSGGEARRVSVARALAVKPEVVLLDEPFTNLDARARQAITEDLDRNLRDTGAAAVLVTHDPSEALRLSDRIDVLHRGTIVQSGPPAQVMNEPVNEFVAGAMGMETIVPAVVIGHTGGEILLEAGGQHILAIGEGAPGDRAYCCIRPENVILEAHAPAGTSARNVFRARVTGSESVGPYLKVRLHCGFPLVATVTGGSYATLGLARGREVFASFKATAVHVIRRSDG